MSSKRQLTTEDTVLVTGGNGHVGQNLVKQLLDHPGKPRVLASVRSQASGAPLKAFFAAQSDRLTLVYIPDITVPGAFDTALETHGVTYIAHVASPLALSVEDVERDLLEPAIQGTLNVLKSALKMPKIKAIVVTGSCASVFDNSLGFRPGYTYTSDDWNVVTRADVTDPNANLSKYPDVYRPFLPYLTSKKLSEEALWEFYHSQNPKPSYALSVLLPTYIGGPYLLPVKVPDGLSYSMGLIWRVMQGETIAEDFPNWVDVRDVAKAHVQALVSPAADGRRWIVSSGTLTYSQMQDIIREVYPEQPEMEKYDLDVYTVDVDTPRKILGIDAYIPKEKMIQDTVLFLLEVSKKQKQEQK